MHVLDEFDDFYKKLSENPFSIVISLHDVIESLLKQYVSVTFYIENIS